MESILIGKVWTRRRNPKSDDAESVIIHWDITLEIPIRINMVGAESR